MIQRIQSVYLFLVVISAALFNFLPLGIDAAEEGDITLYAREMIPLLAVSSVIGLTALITIFLYSNRKLQMSLCKLNLVLVFGLIGLTAYYLLGIPEQAIETPGVGLAIPLFLLIFNFLALKKIDDDEQLVRSMDRLR